MRYFGQNYEHEVEIDGGELDEAALERAFRRFDELHAERYGYAIEREVIELVSFKVTVIGKRAPLDLSRANGAGAARALASARCTSAARASSTRRSSHRSSLEPGEPIAGPGRDRGGGLDALRRARHDRRAHRAGRARDPDRTSRMSDRDDARSTRSR